MAPGSLPLPHAERPGSARFLVFESREAAPNEEPVGSRRLDELELVPKVAVM